jgi:hypothetical protein
MEEPLQTEPIKTGSSRFELPQYTPRKYASFDHIFKRNGVEEELEFRWFVEPGRPVMANKVSVNGENASGTRENVVGSETERNREFSYVDEN